LFKNTFKVEEEKKMASQMHADCCSLQQPIKEKCYKSVTGQSMNASFTVREHLLKKRMFSFGHCPNSIAHEIALW